MRLFRGRNKGISAFNDSPSLPPKTDVAPDEPALSDQAATTGQELTEPDTARGAAPETIEGWAELYARSCGEVHAAADACTEKASHAIAARNKAAEPQHPASSRSFLWLAQKTEEELATLYGAFERACSKARETASHFLAAADEAGEAENTLFKTAPRTGPDTLENVLHAQAILRSSFGPSPASFIEGVQQWYQLAGNPDPADGFIYTPRAPSADERSCPWCAETIEARAPTCRFCGRDAREKPNTL